MTYKKPNIPPQITSSARLSPTLASPSFLRSHSISFTASQSPPPAPPSPPSHSQCGRWPHSLTIHSLTHSVSHCAAVQCSQSYGAVQRPKPRSECGRGGGALEPRRSVVQGGSTVPHCTVHGNTPPAKFESVVVVSCVVLCCRSFVRSFVRPIVRSTL